MGIFLIIKVMKLNDKMQYLRINQFCTRFYVAIQGKYQAKKIGYELTKGKLQLFFRAANKLVGFRRLFFLCEKINAAEQVQSVKSLSST